MIESIPLWLLQTDIVCPFAVIGGGKAAGPTVARIKLIEGFVVFLLEVESGMKAYEAKVGQWYSWANEKMLCVSKADSHGNVKFVQGSETQDGSVLTDVSVFTNVTHLPDCTGWDWEPEVVGCATTLLDPGEGYRLLGPDELVEEGDERMGGVGCAPRRWLCTSSKAGTSVRDLVSQYKLLNILGVRRKVDEPELELPDPGDGWRLLDKDEPLVEGDEYYSRSCKTWVNSVNMMNTIGRQAVCLVYRRRIEAPEPKTIDPGYGWRLLGDDEPTIEGDQCTFRGQRVEWEDSVNHKRNDGKQASLCHYRRRIDVGDGWRLVELDEDKLETDEVNCTENFLPSNFARGHSKDGWIPNKEDLPASEAPGEMIYRRKVATKPVKELETMSFPRPKSVRVEVSVDEWSRLNQRIGFLEGVINALEFATTYEEVRGCLERTGGRYKEMNAEEHGLLGCHYD